MSERVYYPKTTVQQRLHLFKVWEKTGDVEQACSAARVSRSTFYYWKDRFITHGDAGLMEERQLLAPANTLPEAIAEEIVAMKKRNPTWGKWQIAREISDRHPERLTMSPNTVRRVLTAAGLWW